MNIIVTTPKNQREVAAKEAESCKRAGGGVYIRRFANRPVKTFIGERIYYVEDGYVRGFAVIKAWVPGAYQFDADGNEVGYDRHGGGWNALMNADTWCWIKPIPKKGFQGWAYFTQDTEIVGDWLTEKPKT